MRIFRGQSTIPTPALLTACVGILLAAVPMWGEVAPWAGVMLLGCVGVRLVLNVRGMPLPALPVKLLLLAAGVAAVTANYGSIFGLEPGLGILLILISLKLMETNGPRDFQVLILLGFFLSLCGLFFSQDLRHGLYVGVNVTLLASALIQFHRGPSGSFGRSLRQSAALFAQALPLIAVLFLLFPRMSGGLRFHTGRSLQNMAGLSEKMAPGSIASLALRDDPVFRAQFPDGNVPLPSALYWRGVVLWQCDGMTWSKGAPAREPRPAFRGNLVRQSILLQPHGTTWLFGLDYPAQSIAGTSFEAGGTLRHKAPVMTTLLYEVISQGENRQSTLPPDVLAAASRKPPRVSPEVQALVDEWKTKGAGEKQLIGAALAYFRENGFSYSLEPGIYDGEEMDEFLFRRRVGFCEHYAGTFAALMRIAGIPSRVVLGYHGGEYNAFSGYVGVRQSDAHAWCEVWMKGVGWQRIDPTSAIAPDRIGTGLQTYLQTQAAAADGGNRTAEASRWRTLLPQMRMLWDSLAYQWDLRVLNFDEEHQRAFLALIGIGNWRWNELLLAIGIIALLVLAALAFWLRRPRGLRRDRAGAWFARFLRKMAAAGVPREPWEGPRAFAERAAQVHPDHAARIREIGAIYSDLRYGKDPPRLRELSRAVRALPRLRPSEKPRKETA
jgi:protein-glutamine gamma-glutamyltransferase